MVLLSVLFTTSLLDEPSPEDALCVVAALEGSVVVVTGVLVVALGTGVDAID